MKFSREPFRCPTCHVEYLVERIEAPPIHRQVQVICVECGGPLRSREGKFALSYRRTEGHPTRGVIPFGRRGR
jgi:hypothetical protein